MPFHNKRKTTRASWSPDIMRHAVEVVRRGEMGVKRAAKLYSVPVSTLRDKVRSNSNEFIPKLGRNPTLGREFEADLVKYLVKTEARGFGLTRADIRRLTFQFSERNGIAHTFNKQYGHAGVYWLKGFMKRHPNLSIRKAEGLSRARAMGMNRQQVSSYFDKLEETMTKEGFLDKPTHIYNVDETGLQLVNKASDVVALKGRKSVVSITTAEKGETVTVVGCCSASGLYIPPYVVMKGKRMKDEYSDGLPPGSKLSLSDTGYINSDLFLDWLKHFRSFACPGKVLLLVDGHASHAKSVAVLDYARDKDIIMFCLPPHTTKYLQPLDRSVYKPLKVFYQHRMVPMVVRGTNRKPQRP